MSKEKENNFESNLKKLEVIVDKLESDDIGLEESVKLYEEGMKIKKICDKKLKDIEQVENHNIKKKFTDEMEGKVPYNDNVKINFNLLEKTYFFIRRTLESKKKSRKNF